MRDSFGALWLTSQRQLYKACANLCAAQFAPDEVHPFLDGRHVVQVLVDQQGNAMLRTNQRGMEEYVIVAARSPQPDTGLELVKNAPDSVTIHFSTTTPDDRHWFTWRLDDGPWSPPLSQSQERLNFLPPGHHRIEARAIDNRLQIDPTPAQATFEVRIDSRTQLAKLIALLGSANYAEREAAVQGLVQQPTAPALAALKAARDKAKDDQRWWIDTAIQQIEENQRKSNKQGEKP